MMGRVMAEIPSTSVPRTGEKIYGGPGANVLKERRGGTVLLRFVGDDSPELVAWAAEAFKGTRAHAVLNLSELKGVGKEFIKEVIEFARGAAQRKKDVALVGAPVSLAEAVERAGEGHGLVLLSSEASIERDGSIKKAMERERKRINEIAGRFEANPLWRKVDQEGIWLCPLCGTLAEEVRIVSVLRPERVALRGVLTHLLDRCRAWRAGRTVPFPASMLDGFLAEINKRKAAAADERKEVMTRQIRSLEGRVEDLRQIEESVSEAKERVFHLLPIEPAPDQVADLAVVYRPLQQVGGDFLDFYSLEEDRFAVGMGDVSGHGVEAAIVMGMAKMAFRTHSGWPEPVRDRMMRVNRDLFEEMKRTAFVTGAFAEIERSTRRMIFVRAGHPPPLLRRAAGGCDELDVQGLPFGVDCGPRFDATLEECEVVLSPGDVLLFYTDGVTEAGTPEEFGTDRLREALMQAPADGTAREILDFVTGQFDAFLGGAPSGDDTTLICLKIQ